MRRTDLRASFLALCVGTALLGGSGALYAEEPTPPGEEASPPPADNAPPGEGSPPGENGGDGKIKAVDAESDKKKAELGSLQWKDILVVPRRPILKYHRVELVPTYNVSISNTLVRHHGFGGILNFFLSETLAIGLEANYLQPQQLEHYTLRGLDDRVLPSVNRYFWNASVNFSYVPLYGKFALFNRYIFQWEAYIEAGIGAMQSQWIPRDPANDSTSNFLAQGHWGLGTRLFLTKWLVIHAYLKGYLFADKYEPADRPANTPATALDGDSRFVHNVVFGVGVGMFLPTSFDYKYTR